MAATTFGRYKLIRLLARGGMAEVYLGILSGVAGFEKRIALKKILPIYTDMEEFNRLFQDEARISVSLNHSNIVQVFDFGVHNGEYFLAMEYVDGPDLEKILIGARKLGRQLSIDAVVHIAMRIASALEYAHSRVDQKGRSLDLVHRDVSPPNVLLSVQGEVKLTDFGVARYAQRISRSRPGVVRGKYAYMSPEQLTGDVLDSRSDLFSLGVLLFEMLTNVNPFLGESDYKTMEKVVACRPGAVTDYRSGVPRDLVRIIERCLRLHPETRYQTAGQIRRDLAELMFARGVIDDPQLLVDELWSLFPSQLSRRGLSVPQPREDDPSAVSVGLPRMRAGHGVTAGDPWEEAEDVEDEDDHDPSEDLTIPHIVANPDAIPTQPLDGRSHTMDAPPLSAASEATLREEENPFAVKGLTARSWGDAPAQVEATLEDIDLRIREQQRGEDIARGVPGIQAALASPLDVDEVAAPQFAETDEVFTIDEPSSISGAQRAASLGDASVDLETRDRHPAIGVGAAPSEEETREPTGDEPITEDSLPAADDPGDAPTTEVETEDPAEVAPTTKVSTQEVEEEAKAAAQPTTSPGKKRRKTSPGKKRRKTTPGAKKKRKTTPKGKAPARKSAPPAEEDEFPLFGYILVALVALGLFWFAVNSVFGPSSSGDAGGVGDRGTQTATKGPKTSDTSTSDTPATADPPAASATPSTSSAEPPVEDPSATLDPVEPVTPSVGDVPVEQPTPRPEPRPEVRPEPTPRPEPRTPSTSRTSPTPAPAATMGSKMVITTDPPGATLTVDGRAVGESPHELQRPSGTIIEIIARKDGYLSTTRLARFQDTESSTVVQLSEAPKPADEGKVKVTVTSKPWAYVAVDGVVTGKSTPVTLELAPGSHTITVENPLESWREERAITVKEGRATAVAFKKK